MLAPPISTVGTMIRTMPATKRDCGLITSLLPYPADPEYRATRRSPAHLAKGASTELPRVVDVLGSPASGTGSSIRRLCEVHLLPAGTDRDFSTDPSFTGTSWGTRLPHVGTDWPNKLVGVYPHVRVDAELQIRFLGVHTVILGEPPHHTDE